MVDALRCDVLVVGGGPAGVGAALAAERSGARTVLLEQQDVLGGQAVRPGVDTLCGLFIPHPRQPTPGPEFICRWLVRDLTAGGRQPVRVDRDTWVLPCFPEQFAAWANKSVEETSIQALCGAKLTAVERQRDRVVQAFCSQQGAARILQPSCIVDATGDATVVDAAGVPTADVSDSQCAAAVAWMSNVGSEACSAAGRLAILRRLMRAVHAGQLSPDAAHLHWMPLPRADGRLLVKLNLPVGRSGPENRWRERVRELGDFLLKNIPAFAEATLVRVGERLGIRASRTIYGRECLTEQDVVAQRQRADGVACGAWPVEQWISARAPRWVPGRCGRWYEVPAGALRPLRLANVWAAGRCIAASAGALASARVVGTALATGWAAGELASAEVRGDPEHITVRRLRQQRTACCLSDPVPQSQRNY